MIYKYFNKNDLIDGRYKVETILQGGMGIVYICFDVIEKQFVALKTFKSEVITDEEVVDAFKNECKIWVSIPWHINIVRAFGILNYHGIPFIIMEYIAPCSHDCSNLRDIMTQDLLTDKEKLEIAMQICSAFIHVNSHFTFIYRDLKPENILVTNNKTIKITDFGISKIFSDSRDKISSSRIKLEQKSTVKGTLLYMSPEQINNSALDFKTDIFSFGILFAELIFGIHPFTHKVNSIGDVINNILNNQPFYPNIVNGSIEKGVIRILDRCLAKIKSSRYDNFHIILKEIEELYMKEYGTLFIQRHQKEISEELWNLLSKANSLVELKYYDEAERILLNLIKIIPDIFYPWYNLALLYSYRKRYDESIAMFKKTLELKKDDPVIINNYGLVLSEKGDYQNAKAVFNSAIIINPLFDKPYNNLSTIAQTEGDTDLAIQLCYKVLSLRPNSEKANCNLSFYYSIKMDYIRSLQFAEKAIENNPNYAKAYLRKSISHYYLFNINEAKKSIRIAKELDSKNENINYWHNKLINIVA